MKRVKSTRAKATPPPAWPPKELATREDIEVLMREVVKGVTYLAVYCGFSVDELEALFKHRFARVPKSVRRAGVKAKSTPVDVPHVISLWTNDPAYVTVTGEPRALPAQGPIPSIESLAERVNPSLSIKTVLGALKTADVLGRRGKLYIPKSRILSYRHLPDAHRAHSLRALIGLLKTLEHNLVFGPEQVRWFQYVAENPNVSARITAKIYDDEFRRCKRFLETLDDRLVRAENASGPDETKKRVSWAINYWEEPSLGPQVTKRNASRRR